MSVKSAVRVLDIFELLANRAGGVGLSDLARALHIPKSSAWNLLKTLQARNYIDEPSPSMFVLGPQFFDVAICAPKDRKIREIAREVMVNLVAQTGETAFLGFLTPECDILQVEKVLSPNIIRYDAEIGHKRPAHCTAIGKALLAALTPDRLDVFLERAPFKSYTPYTLTTENQLRAELERVREQGVAWNKEEMVIGAWSVGVAVMGAGNRAIAGITVGGPKDRLMAKLAEISMLARTAAADIAHALETGSRAAIPPHPVGNGAR
ncbi:IclR family transcriptional regulator [Bosea sp. (in: a-proteobacteria)]|uniref:IclR family transcriptional regulator n=1 Tax=Bosea sp. (in: a-proteobacteria) TaxID=1871050 RepID=UPI00261C9892|nr:IclR family transcriptional regulator [Bosea sp. (in: a-proteobacteria)]MCO5089834.1 IclR family transcriptional regulator [Bosea sp. (in: a-proteobacteria)]